MILKQQPVPYFQRLPYDFSGKTTTDLHRCALYHHRMVWLLVVYCMLYFRIYERRPSGFSLCGHSFCVCMCVCDFFFWYLNYLLLLLQRVMHLVCIEDKFRSWNSIAGNINICGCKCTVLIMMIVAFHCSVERCK